jgi:hypothetical protein
MTTLLEKYKAPLLEAALALAWRQWSLLGIPGYEEASRSEHRIIDPESLLLLTTELGRFDARLLDEVQNWLRQHGRLINIQRLKSIHQQHSFGNAHVLSAIATTLLENSRLAKWRAIEALAEESADEISLFRNPDGSPAPIFGKADPAYRRVGYFRGVQKPRRDITPPQVQISDLLLIKLRALFGVNARAEILAALLTTESSHPSAVARRTGYLPRSVQDVLNEMALSGHVITGRPKGTREKYFSLRPNEWNFLITWPEPDFPDWVDWTILFALLHDSLLALFDKKRESSLATAMRFREIFDLHFPALSEAGLAGYFARSAHSSGMKFLDAFLKEIAASLSRPSVQIRN